MRIAYLDCFSGISGDMFLAALLDAGVPFALFEKTVADLNIAASLEISRVDRGGISATKLDVIVNGQKDLPREEFWNKQGLGDRGQEIEDSGRLPWIGGQNPDHSHENEESAAHSHQHSHPHSHDRGGAEHGHSSEHTRAHGRSLSDILKIISAAPIRDRAKQLANEIFLALGAAEAKIHNVDLEGIHFHEVGSADAIVDIVCSAVGADALGVDQFICSPLNVGGGTVTCAHGVLPVPAPATLELLQGAPIYSGEIQKELVTPTGAAIVKVLASSFGSRPFMTTEQIGYGAGSRNFDGHANVLRIAIGQTADIATTTGNLCEEEEIVILEANLDDLNPQLIGYIMDVAFSEGALDVFNTPVQMKKNRPGTVLTILAPSDREEGMRALLFRESSTLGIRVRREKRYALPRHHEAVTTPWGEVRMKVAGLNGSASQYAPEYEDCRRIAGEHHVPLKHVMQEAIRLYLDRQHG
jgi:pyridinium-3,5-bisthiocarboxylic acid mononucleotide nickel chelatase